MSPQVYLDLHRAYCDGTGHQIRADYARTRAWFEFVQSGFTRADLALVIGYLKKEIGKGQRNEGALKFSNLVQQLDRFEEDLALARKLNRVRPAVETVAVQAGSTTVAIERDPAIESEPEHIREAVARELEDTVRNLRNPKS